MLFSDPAFHLPQALSMALAQDPEALDAFGRLPEEEKAHYADRAHQAITKAEMMALVAELGKNRTL